MASGDDPLSLVGTTIVDKYAVESVVGEGGFAVVYRANHLMWNRPVAVKVFKALGEVAQEQRAKLLEDFVQEGRLLAELSERSTAICQARDVGMLKTPRGETVPYMVLEWLDGKPLDAVLESERAASLPLRSLEQVVRLLDPIAEALALAHKKGIAHRDVKPANIFILGHDARDPAGVKLLDFGIAKVVQDVQKMGMAKTAGHITSFTPLYGAPEQFSRQFGATGPWTDVFALALVTSECISGKEPMPGDNLVQLQFAASDPSKRPTPRALGIVLSDDIEAIFAKAVAVKTEDRYQTAGEFWQALRVGVTGDRMSSIASSRGSMITSAGPTDTIVDTRNPKLTAPSAAATTGGGAMGPIGATAMSPVAPPGKSKAPLILGGVAIVAVLAGGVGVLAYTKSHDTKVVPSAAMSATAPPSASSAVPVAAKTDCPKGMLPIPAGEFFMGSDEKDALDFERPAHKVKLAGFCIDELEVTVAQYKACSDKGGCRRAGKENTFPGIKPAQQKIYDPLCNINDPVAKANHPINCVDWDQAHELCESRGARLPTEAEWELAARGPDGRIYPWGDDPPSAKLLNACGKECVAWMKKHPDPDAPIESMYDDDDGFENTAPVGSFPKGKSRYGIQDVVGNVWEWVADWYGDYDKSPPSMAADPKGPATGTDRVIRGGSWNGSHPSWVRPSFRFHATPTSRSYGYGFRCAKSLP